MVSSCCRLYILLGPLGASSAVGCDSSESYRQYHDNGQLASKGELVNASPHGTWEEWYPSGTLRTVTHFRFGIEHGERQHWYEDGQLAAHGDMKNGNRQGEWTLYFPNGTPQARATYIDGVEEGLRTEWYESGQIMSSARVHGGLQHGPRSFYHLNGAIRSTVDFRHGKKQGMETTFDEHGEWIQSECFREDTSYSIWRAERGDSQPTSDSTACPVINEPDTSAPLDPSSTQQAHPK